jgi:hypothetical protein
MKTFKFLNILFILLLVSSCSTNNEDSNQISDEDSFEYKYEGGNAEIKSWTAVKSENDLVVSGMTDDGKVFAIGFNKFGNLAVADSYSATDYNFPSSTSFEYFKSNYFNFELVGIDESNKRVSVKFSGNLYEDNYDLDSTSHYIEGSFNLGYTEVTPQISGLEVSATIEGNDWYSTDSDLSGGLVGSPVSINHFSDDAFIISYVIIPGNVTSGVYNFDMNSTENKMTFLKYDPNTNNFIIYETTGVFNITEHNVGFGLTQIKGTFSFTATKGSEVIQVKNGTINDVYSY